MSSIKAKPTLSEQSGRRLPMVSGEGSTDDGLSRRRFLSLTGASLALAGATACTRQPPELIVPYARQPEDSSSGAPVVYATSMVCGGYAAGLLVRSVTGRPIKIEGNPDHPASLGAADAFAQASILTLYDPDRAQVVTRLGDISTWDRFTAEITRAIQADPAGSGVRILSEAVSSPALEAQIVGLLAELPGAKWHRFEPAGRHNTSAGARLAVGAPVEVRYDFTKADVILTLDADPLASGPGSLRYAHDFAGRREPGPAMSRLYCVESTPTCTGSLADHRLAVRPSEVALLAVAVAAELAVVGVERAGVEAALSALPPKARSFAAAAARDLRARAGRCIVAAGESAPPAVHALVMAINEALGSTESGAVIVMNPIDSSPVDSITSIRELSDDMRAGRVTSLIILGGNPVYAAPADIGFAELMRGVALRVHLSLYENETSSYCHYHIPEAHYLEAWGDARAFDGTASVIQPLVQPLYGGKSAIQLVSALRGRPGASGLDVVRSTWQARLDAGRFEALFRAALIAGFLEGTASPMRRAPILPGAAARAASDITASASGNKGGYELAIRPDPTIHDGQFANNSWLQELPKPGTKLTWDNAAIISPSAAAELGVADEDVVEVVINGRAVRAPIRVLPGQSDKTVTVHLGYGRARAGAATGMGFNAYLLRTTDALWHARGVEIRPTGSKYALAATQEHFRLEGREHARGLTLASLEAGGARREIGPPSSLYPDWRYDGRAWGMSIDIGACTGCNACVVACQAENNIPVVGKDQVRAGREMHWLRIDSYYEGPPDDVSVFHQPMMCVHCEHAPCEYVCPVGATTHSAEGLNEMTYNRCVGTRYCSNNCPYKARRFNFFEYNGDMPEALRLQKNPDVTVRSRGVMEKCTYCVQRISAARIDSERDGQPIRDGALVTACQQACPTGAIVFGDINDPASRVRRLKADPRSYGVLEELNTRPRTTHLARIRNPNPEIEGGRHE